MKYQYNGFIAENIAPKNAKGIGVYDSLGSKILSIPLGRLAHLKKQKLFSFGVVSDLHLTAEQTSTSTHFDNALSFFEEQGCEFCCHTGDMTNIGFWYNKEDVEIYLGQFAEYKRICDKHSALPVYGICGNHESYNKAITENLADLEEYTGNPLYFTVKHNNELFVFIGQPSSYQTINEEELSWLIKTLEDNADFRCHIFVHVFPPNDSGSTKNVYTGYFGQYLESVQALLAQYENAILYHGHSHIKFECQEIDKATVYTRKNGYHSVHIPSVAASRDVVLQSDETYKMVTDESCSQGYIVDVYEDCLVYNGFEFTTKKPVPTGVFMLEVR